MNEHVENIIVSTGELNVGDIQKHRNCDEIYKSVSRLLRKCRSSYPIKTPKKVIWRNCVFDWSKFFNSKKYVAAENNNCVVDTLFSWTFFKYEVFSLKVNLVFLLFLNILDFAFTMILKVTDDMLFGTTCQIEYVCVFIFNSVDDKICTLNRFRNAMFFNLKYFSFKFVYFIFVWYKAKAIDKQDEKTTN